MKTLRIVKDDIAKLDLSYLKEYCAHTPSVMDWFDQPPGQNEYKLYAYLSKKVNNTVILEVGTGSGGSSVSLAHNLKNVVRSYDMKNLPVHDYHLQKGNVTFHVGDFMADEDIDYSKIDIIMIDVDPHDGLQEPPMVDHIVSKGFSGIILFDDISPTEWPAMNAMWQAFPYEKFDLTDVGHWSGTGLLNIGNKFKVEVI